MMNRGVTFRARMILSLLGIVLLSACADEPVQEVVSENVSPPPSVQSNDQGVVRDTVRLTSDQAAELKIETVAVGHSDAAFTVTLPGQVYPAPDRYAQVSAPISGRVVRIDAHEGEPVRQGQPLLALESLEFANLAADYLQAQAEEEYQRLQVERLETLVEKQIAPRSRLDRSKADLNRAHASVSATYARLKALGIPDQELAAWSSQSRERPLLPIYAPISGMIDQHLIDLGQSVTAYQEMMSIVGSDKVMIRGFVSPEDAPMISVGDSVTIGLKDVPGRVISAQVTTINPSVDPENRSVTVNVLTPTHERWPMPGQNVRLEIRASNPRPVIMLPLSTVQYEGEQATVFVRIDPLSYEKRPVKIERMAVDAVIVADGLSEGEEVATTQVFSLKALGRYSQYAED
ncbi:MAG: efflux RND transporter periplasmic adaptor subunit [Candidatus Latescibacterota bacterium]|jgi:cobalt-zinc-cadmium efflux system membrane fusion protein